MVTNLQSSSAGFISGQFKYDNGELSELLLAWIDVGKQATALLFILTILATDLHIILSPLVWFIHSIPFVIIRIDNEIERFVNWLIIPKWGYAPG